MTANDQQIGGLHYKTGGLQHWDIVLMFGLGYFEGQITKYLFRWKKKGGVEDLRKARHFLDKLIESETVPEHKLVATPEGDKGPKAIGPVPDYMQYVKPTGWVGFVFEGADGDGFLFTCGRCRTKVRADQYVSPWMIHDAEECERVTAQMPFVQEARGVEQSLGPAMVKARNPVQQEESGTQRVQRQLAERLRQENYPADPRSVELPPLPPDRPGS
jgi:hypothetical protein